MPTNRSFSDTINSTTETTSFGTITANRCRSSFLVALQGSNLGTPPSPATANLSSTPGAAIFFAGPDCTGSPVTSVTVPAGQSSAAFSFRIALVGSYTLSGVGNWDSGSKHASATVTVTQGTSSLAAATATGTYGGTANLSATLRAGGAGVSGKTITFKLNGGTVGTGTTDTNGTATLSSASLTSPTKINAGTFSTGVSASFAGDSSFTSSSGSNSLTVSQKAITVTAATNTKSYDGTTSAAAVPTITSGGPLVSRDTPNFTESYNNKNAGVGNKTLIPAGTVSDGNSGNNYTYTFVNVTTGTINPLAITVTAATNTKTYDGTTSSTGAPTITMGSLASGDTTTSFTQVFDSRNAGSRTLTPSGTVTDGNDGNNYAYTFTTASGSISKRPITVMAATDSKQYDGTTSSTGAPSITMGSMASGDTTTTFTQVFDSRNAGSRTLTPSGTVNDGNTGANYAYTFTKSSTTGRLVPPEHPRSPWAA